MLNESQLAVGVSVISFVLNGLSTWLKTRIRADFLEMRKDMQGDLDALKREMDHTYVRKETCDERRSRYGR